MYIDKRSEFIDIIRGVAIVCVVWGHCIQYCALDKFDFFDNLFFKTIYSFHMPLFMLVCGYLFANSVCNHGIHAVLTKRVTSLSRAIVGGVIFNYYILAFFGAIRTRTLGDVLSAGWVYGFNEFWFIWSILASTIVVGTIIAKIKEERYRNIFFFFCAPCVYLFPNGGNNLFMYPYFIIGIWFYKYKMRIPVWIMKLRWISVPIFMLLLCLYKKQHFIYTTGIWPFDSPYGIIGQIIIDIYRYIIGLIGSIAVIVFIEALMAIFKENQILGWIALLGRNSLQIYIIQKLIVESLFAAFYKELSTAFGYNILAQSLWCYNLFYMPVLAIVFLILIIYFIKALYIVGLGRYIFGKDKC